MKTVVQFALRCVGVREDCFFVFSCADFEFWAELLRDADFYAQKRPGTIIDPASNRWDSKGLGKADAKA